MMMCAGQGKRWLAAWRRRRSVHRVTISTFPLAALLSLLVVGAGHAEQPAADRLERVVILTRHGVRGAMSAPEELGGYTRLAWPSFSAPPGILTAHGATLLTMMGEWYRARYQAVGLLRAGDCAVYLWANHTQRTVASAKALAQGLAPRCALAVNQSPQEPDPLFDAPLTPFAPPDNARLLAAISARVGGNLAAWDARQRPQLDRFEALLLQCARTPCSAEERGHVRHRLSDTPIVMRLDEQRALQLSSPALAVGGLAESLIMAYADGRDFAGWRGMDSRTIGPALAVHGAAIDLRTRTREVGRQSSSYLAMRLLATLQRGAGVPVLADPVGDGQKIVVLAGHDGTLTMLAGLLGLNWQLPGYGAGEAAPGGAILFELWRRGAQGRPFVRVLYAAQSLEQMRHLAPLSLERPPASEAIAIAGCPDRERGCPLDAFTQHVLRQIAPPARSKRQERYPPPVRHGPKLGAKRSSAHEYDRQVVRGHGDDAIQL